MAGKARTVIGLLGAAGIAAGVRAWRHWHLAWGATPDEVARALPGDDLVKSPTFDATRAITIGAPPER
ncbi:MAG: hypothetical protein ACLGIS_14145, partial [Actinomycetes bacterium]